MNFLQNQNPPVSRFSDFSSNKYLQGTKEFLNSNSFIARLAFLFLVIVLFILALRLGFYLLSKVFSFKTNPILLNGMIDSKEMFIIPQNPSTPGAIPVQRSANQDQGIEFTWSTWIYINDLSYKQGQFRHIFHKGNDNINLTTNPKGMNYPNNAPGLYIAPDTNELVVVMNTFNNITEKVQISNFPVKKWVNVIIRCNGSVVDIFVNGTLTRRQKLSSVIKQNYGDVYVSMNGGFDGYTSSLRYFSSALNTSEIMSIVNNGPNTKPLGNIDLSKIKNSNYLSQRWFNDKF
jgi:hypothetical protein